VDMLKFRFTVVKWKSITWIIFNGKCYE